MNISYNWLKQYLTIKDDAQTIANILTTIGLEVDGIETVQSIKGGLEGLVVGEVITCIPHPNSDHLHITTTRLHPNEEPVQIVCGAPNVSAGQKVIVATVGTKLYSGDEELVIKKSKIRGEESLGMICAEDEIGIGTSHEGIIVLPQDTPVGLPAKEYYHLEDDYVIEVDITPNRSDALSHYGVARDLHAYYMLHNDGYIPELTKPSVEDFKVQNHNYPITIQVRNTEACPRYSGVTITGVKIGPSPKWLQERLQTIGVRSINNVVDATNYVLHEQGTALHPFDADKIVGRTIIVDNATPGEKFTTLDGIERTLTGSELMIKNGECSMCMAGVFGGLDSGIIDTTTNVFLESAYFNPVSIRKTARHHQLSTDASFRYERGCDPCNVIYNLKRCALLIQQVAGGEISMDVVDVASDIKTLTEPFHIEVSHKRINELIGKEITVSELETIFKGLEMTFVKRDDDLYDLCVPKYRVDVQRECDVVEDILRIYGYNNVPFAVKMQSNLSTSSKASKAFSLQRLLSEQLSAQGFREIVNNSLTKRQYYVDDLTNVVQLLNPLSQDLGVMRTTLLFGGLETIQRNVNRQVTDLKLYEFGNCYHYKATDSTTPLDAYSEEKHLGLWLTGRKSPERWTNAIKDQKVSFYLLHAYVNTLLSRVGIDVHKCVLTALQSKYFTDGLQVTYNNQSIGYMGIVSQELLNTFDLHEAVYYADLDWKVICQLHEQYKPIIVDVPKYPSVKRDFALLVDKSTLFADLKALAEQTERKLLKDVYLFDVYEGKGLPEGKKSYAVSFVLRDDDKTLKDVQIESVMARLQKAFEEKFNAILR